MAYLRNPDVPHFTYDDWPQSSGLKLEGISEKGTPISVVEMQKNRDFYMSLLWGARLSYKEGKFVYRGITVEFK